MDHNLELCAKINPLTLKLVFSAYFCHRDKKSEKKKTLTCLKYTDIAKSALGVALVLELWKLRQGDFHELKISLGDSKFQIFLDYRARPCLNKEKREEKKLRAEQRWMK